MSNAHKCSCLLHWGSCQPRLSDVWAIKTGKCSTKWLWDADAPQLQRAQKWTWSHKTDTAFITKKSWRVTEYMRLKERHVWVALSKCHALKTISGTTGSSGPSFSSSYIIWSYTTAFSHKQLVNWTAEVQAHFRGLQQDLCGRDWISTQGACYGISGTDNGCTSNTGWVKHHWWNWWPSRKGAKLTQKNLIL